MVYRHERGQEDSIFCSGTDHICGQCVRFIDPAVPFGAVGFVVVFVIMCGGGYIMFTSFIESET